MVASPVARGVTELASAVRCALDSPEPDQIHDLRVAIRRFLQVLAVYESSPRVVRDGLKEMMRSAGDVRDCDIAIKLVKKVDGPARLIQRLRRRRGDRERVLLIELQKWSKGNMASQWRQKLSFNGEADPAILRRAVKKFFKCGAAAEDSDTKLHPLRIATKKLRYTMDLIGNTDRARAEQVRELQQRLGDIQDHETARRLASDESASKRVLSELQNRQDKKIRAFRKFWDKTFAGRKREWQQVTLRSRTRPVTVAPRKDATVMRRA